jgi:hypothetical protein
MSKGKSYNRIVFFTTLSVYLGLVLVGATPQVLAQNGLSNFSQVKRDNKFICPNSGLVADEIGKEINPFEYAFAETLIELIKTTDLRIKIVKEIERKQVNLPFHFKQIEFFPYFDKKGELIDYDWEDKYSDWASAAHAGQISELHSLFLNPLCDCSETLKQKIVLNSSDIRIDNKSLVSELIVNKASKQRADQLAGNLKQLFDSRASLSINQAVKEVYKNTHIRSKNNQVFIVTRLPRGSIDSLLAKND